MATAPEVLVHVTLIPPTSGTRTRKPSDGQKLPWYRAAARNRADRSYTPRFDIIDAE